ncbi:hypothetical protein Patl1_32279 [Pistacia atlantica]|uniref:Uncharacterized protein n=1 Tax=Pistacia atlantica TaxID=434234 RepID=A0ACC1AR50_9ROSI|nr:hypothetical protein Patl1_32279 [Pistacia atlantica]
MCCHVLIRRAQVADVLPGNYKVNAGQDIMISVYNIHHSSQNALVNCYIVSCLGRNSSFIAITRSGRERKNFCRKDLTWKALMPNETNTDFRFIPFSGGPRKCVGDQFALLEAIVALTIFLQKMNFELVPDQNINMTTGATIHTTNGLYMRVTQRQPKNAVLSSSSSSVACTWEQRPGGRCAWVLVGPKGLAGGEHSPKASGSGG